MLLLDMDIQQRGPGDILAEIARSSQGLSERRGEHAAALWSVNDFLAGLPGTHVEYQDAVALESGHRLAILADEGWGLFLEGAGGRVRAYRGAADEIVAAVRRLPEFLTDYAEHLKKVSGSKLTTSIAQQFVQAVSDSQPQTQD